MIRAALALLLMALPAVADETIVAGLSQSRVSIDADFTGEEILVYGAVKRFAPPPSAEPLHLVITVEGPAQSITVRRKDRRFGIWVPVDSFIVTKAPAFYALATTGETPEILSDIADAEHRITIPRAIRAFGATETGRDADDFVDALIRLRLDQGLYREDERTISFVEETLFRTDIALPANLTEGAYRVRIFLLRGGEVVDHLERQVNVRKAGIERFLFNLSREQPAIYGLLSLLIAVLAGYGASGAFRLIRR